MTASSGRQGIFCSVGNPYLLRDALGRLDLAFSEVIDIFESEQGGSVEPPGGGNVLLDKLRGWRDELEGFKRHSESACGGVVTNEGGMFVD